MNKQSNTQLKNSLNQRNSLSNNNCMSTIKTYIEDSSTNFNINKEIYNIDEFDAGKLKIYKYQNRKTSLDEIQAIYFDKTIYSLLGKKKMNKSDYFYFLYIFFIQETYRSYVIQLGHKNFSKFLKKFFNSCKKSNIFTNYDIAEYIDCYMLSLYQLITGIKNENNISKLKEKQIRNLKDLDSVDKKYMKLLVKYILAFCNILEYTKEYKNYPNIIFDSFSNIKDIFFHEYFMKQLNKIYLNKGLYIHGKKIIQKLFYSIIYNDNKKSIYDFTKLTSYLINSVLHYQFYYLPKNIKVPLIYMDNSPFYFLNIVILIQVLNNMYVNKDLIQKITFKFIDFFNNKINLFIDDGNKLRVAEYLLTDSINNKLIFKFLDIIKIIQPYFIIEESNINNNNKNYFDYLFFDLTIDKYIINNFVDNSNSQNIDTKDMNYSIASISQEIDIDNSFNNNNNNINIYSEKDYIKLILNKFTHSNDYFINKYFNTNDNNKINIENNNENINEKGNFEENESEKKLSEKCIEELFILLDILYYISLKFCQEIKQKSILDIKKIIKFIIIKSFEEKKFNCTIFNFILNIDKIYLPLSSDFNIINSNEILMKKSFIHFIKTYPLYIIFIINYFPKNNFDISEFFSVLKSFMIGYLKNVFNSIDENMNEYNHTLQLNYLSIIYFIINQILYIYNYKDKSNNELYDIKVKILHLPYCINCQKKIKCPLIFSNYLSQCNYCGEKSLYINTNLYDYIFNKKNEIKKFIDECVFHVITGITCNILFKFKVKYEKRNINSMFCYNLYYKIMSEHFQFLNNIKLIIGKNIPFVVDINCDINNREGALEEYMNTFFERYLTNKSKYPFKSIYETIDKDNFESFNSFRKTIKHECELSKHKYFKN